jgi:hypothetical protein
MIVDENGMCTLSEEDCSYHSHTAKRTNADKIRSMSDEELAELWWERVDCGECPVHRDCRMTGQDCKKLALDWLRQEAT